jgi:two-component system NtrC family sensor kinase
MADARPGMDDVDYEHLEDLWRRLEPAIVGLPSLEDVARLFTDALYERFASSIVLARVFGTVELHQLPAEDRAFVDRFAASMEAAGLSDVTPVLSLLASRGVETAWNDRRRSQGHLAIPLVSENFVGRIPMISRLLNEIGFTPSWRGSDSGFVTKTLANVNGIFYVADARTAVDDLERPIIPATSFVEDYGVRTVFGFGGSYLGRHMFVSAILFCREEISRSQAMRFIPLIGSLKAATTRLVNRGAIFASHA